MSRPPKHVPPDTLGGRIRAARESLHLSLAKVAADRYSTSLISQIERNRVEPSQKSLQFLATQLQLPLEDLKVLANQQRDTESNAQFYTRHEELLMNASQVLVNKPEQALMLLRDISMPQVPAPLRWRFAALRGLCYLTLRQFLPAHKDFLYAVTEQPQIVPSGQHEELMSLHLRLAATHRVLGQSDAAFEEYQAALHIMDTNTPLHYVAEANWGISLIAFERANTLSSSENRAIQLQIAHQHAENACILYRSIGETLRAALMTCQKGLIEQGLGYLDDARKHLGEVLSRLKPELNQHVVLAPADQQHLKELANVVSAVACALAGIELEDRNYQTALTYVQQARDAGQLSNVFRYAEAEMMLGQILEANNPHTKEAESAFRAAVTVLDATDRLAARIRAHGLLAHHLMKNDQVSAGEEELAQARRLFHVVMAFSGTTISVASGLDDIAKLS